MADPDRAANGRKLVLIAAILWSLSGVATKGIGIDPISIAVYRSGFAGLVLLPFVPRARWAWRPELTMNVLVFGAMIGSYIAAIKYTTAANAIFLQCTSVFWTIPLSYIRLGERPDRRSLLGIGLAMIGVGAILAKGYDGRPGEGWGVTLALFSGLAYAWVAVGLRKARGLDPAWLSAVNNLGGAIALAMAATVCGSPPALATPTEAIWLLAFGSVQMAIPYALFARGLRDIGAPEAGLIALVEPVLNPLWVFLAQGERPAPATIVGGTFLLAGVLIRYIPIRRRDRHKKPVGP